jgi:hypothetical protein
MLRADLQDAIHSLKLSPSASPHPEESRLDGV